MSTLHCVPLGVRVTLADVAAMSNTTPEQTFALTAGTQLVIEAADGDDIAVFDEAGGGVTFPGHVAIGNQAAVDTSPPNLRFNYIGINYQDVQSVEPNGQTGGIVISLDSLPTINDSASQAFGVYVDLYTTGSVEIGSLYGISGGAQNLGDAYVGDLVGLAYYAWGYSPVGSVYNIYLDAWATECDYAYGIDQYVYPDQTNIEAYGAYLYTDTPAPIQYGLYLDGLTLAADNYAVYAPNGQSYFGGDFQVAGDLGLNGATPVAQSTGWNATNVVTDKVFDADTVTLQELADVVGTLINYLKLRGDLA